MLIRGELEGCEETSGWDIEEVELVREAESVMSDGEKDMIIGYD
jgi:hypothetical protein